MDEDHKEMKVFLAKFWDWMHHKWPQASHMDACSMAENNENFKEYVDKFFVHLNEYL